MKLLSKSVNVYIFWENHSSPTESTDEEKTESWKRKKERKRNVGKEKRWKGDDKEVKKRKEVRQTE